ncbi:hypothetical protein [Armatimonas sp.]|uniref:hypothetical protein n=1 Tax=Armatimonas sp. TaxID=1872638 RepID=UPI003753A398
MIGLAHVPRGTSLRLFAHQLILDTHRELVALAFVVPAWAFDVHFRSPEQFGGDFGDHEALGELMADLADKGTARTWGDQDNVHAHGDLRKIEEGRAVVVGAFGVVYDDDEAQHHGCGDKHLQLGRGAFFGDAGQAADALDDPVDDVAFLVFGGGPRCRMRVGLLWSAMRSSSS